MKRNKTWMWMLIVTSGLLTAGMSVKAASADKQLQKGIEAYQQNDEDKALDYFIDVLMNGDNEQQAQANKYINAIHNRIGGIKQPVEVDVSFPDQPVQTVLTSTDTWAKQGAQQGQALIDQANQTAQDAIDALNEAPRSLTEQIEQRQLANYTQQGLQPVTATQEAVLDNAVVLSNQAAEGAQTVQQDLNAIANQYTQEVSQQGQQLLQKGKQAVDQVQNAAQSEIDEMYQLANDYELEYQGLQSAVPASYQEVPAIVSQPLLMQQSGTEDVGVNSTSVNATNISATNVGATNGNATNVTVIQEDVPSVPTSAFVDLTTPQAIEARNLYTAQKLQSMREGAIAALSAEKGVHLYLTPDGRPEAIDIDNGVLFQGNSFRTESFDTLNTIYELLALTQDAYYIILPAGSYTDDVTLSGIRQAMALKSYLAKRGISEGKLYYNMGLVDQEVPNQFANLKGLSIVFNYGANLPTRLLENAEKETNPLLSMAVVPPCHAIDRSLGEAYAIDFSVLDTVHPVKNWTLQIIQHGRNGSYYIVRQLEGFGPVYHQILWNGRKGIIGPELPCGKYTLVLSAVDALENKNVLRRRVVVKCAGAAVMGSCQTGACVKQEKTAKTVGLNYQAARLWHKPGRVMRCTSGCGSTTTSYSVEAEEGARGPEAAAAVQTEETVTSSDSSGTYTKTETVRNIVVDDTSSSADDLYLSNTGGYAPMPSNAGGYMVADGNAEEAIVYE